MEPTRFAAYLAQGFNHIPVYRTILADLDTPLSAYLKLADAPYSYLFESVQGGEKWGRYSIIGLPASMLFYVHDHEVTVEVDGDIIEQQVVDDPLESVRQFQSRFRVPEVDDLPKFNGGLVGYFGYDIVHYIEPSLSGAKNKGDEIGAPDILLMVADEVLVFDNLSGRLHIVVHVDPDTPQAYRKGLERLEALADALHEPLPRVPSARFVRLVDEDDFEPSFEEGAFKEAVEECREYIRDGDIFQVVLSSRMSVPYYASPIDLYRSLRTLNPSL